MIPHSLVEKVCSNYDPFCQAARGAKLFDENTAPSLTYSSRDVFPLTTNANGVALVWFNGSPSNTWATATVVAGAVTAWTAAQSTFYNNVTLAGLARWRTVSGGIRYMTTQAWSTATGHMIVTETTESLDVAVVGQVAGSLTLGPLAHTIPLRDAQFTCVQRQLGMNAKTYKEATSHNPYYTGFTVYANGTPSTTIGYIEVVVNYEWIPDASTVYQAFSTPAAPNIPLVTNAVATLATGTNNIQMLTDGISATAGFMTQAKQAVHQVTGIVDDVAAIGGMVSPVVRAVGGMSGALHALTS